jgi:hypothetical protein
MAKGKRKRLLSDDPVVQELIDIKRLLIFQLMVAGVQQAQIAAALQVDAGTVSRLVPASLAKKKQRKG